MQLKFFVSGVYRIFRLVPLHSDFDRLDWVGYRKRRMPRLQATGPFLCLAPVSTGTSLGPPETVITTVQRY